jgi:outer membrane protein assembly factor BamB
MRRTLAVLALLLAVSVCAAEEWPGWRGPRGDGTSTEKGVPVEWGTTKNVRWKTAIPGKGHSSPVVWGDRIFLTTCVEHEGSKGRRGDRVLICLDRKNGKVHWQRTILSAPLEAKHALNSFASSTPVTDGKLVWVAFEDRDTMQVACYDFAGKRKWLKSPGEFHSKHGFCSSPVVYKDLVIFNGDQDAEAWIVALDKTTGAERWRAARPNRTRSYCPPVLIDVNGKKQLVLTGSKCVASYDPDNGKQIWIVDGPTEQFVASIVYRNGVVFLTAGFPTYHLMGIRPDGKGDVTKTHVAFHHANIGSSNASYVPSPIATDKYFFVVADVGFLHCLDGKTGKRLWKHRLGQHHSASPVSAGGYLYFPDDTGRTWVIKPSPKCEIVARNDLKEEIYASPAVSRGQLFLRTVGHLYCIGAE